MSGVHKNVVPCLHHLDKKKDNNILVTLFWLICISTGDYLIKRPTSNKRPPPATLCIQENDPFAVVMLSDFKEAAPESLLIDLSDNEVR